MLGLGDPSELIQLDPFEQIGVASVRGGKFIFFAPRE